MLLLDTIDLVEGREGERTSGFATCRKFVVNHVVRMMKVASLHLMQHEIGNSRVSSLGHRQPRRGNIGTQEKRGKTWIREWSKRGKTVFSTFKNKCIISWN